MPTLPVPDPRCPLLAPGSPTYRTVSDLSVTYGLMGVMVLGTMQAKAGQGVYDHDEVFRQPSASAGLKRLYESWELVAGIILSDTAEDRAQACYALRELHRVVRGTMPDGEAYHAWEHELWAYAWVGIFKAILDAYEFCHGWSSTSERDQALAGFVELGRMIGVRGVPEDYDEFIAYCTNYYENVAQPNRTVQFILSQIAPGAAPPGAPEWVPQIVWDSLTFPVRRFLYIGALATFPPVAVERTGLHPTALDRLELRAHGAVWRRIPQGLSGKAGPAVLKLRRRFVGPPVWDTRFSFDQLARRREASDARPRTPRRAVSA